MLPTVATRHYNSQRTLAEKALWSVSATWRRVGDDFDAGWASVGGGIISTVQEAMHDAAADGAAYVPAILEQTRQDAGSLIPADPAAFTDVNRDGTPVAEILHVAIVRAKQAVGSGLTPEAGLLEGRKFLTAAVPTLIADANGGAVHATLTTTPVTGYVRMLNPPSCRRCIPLAGKWFRWNEGFRRHPLCECKHIPVAENRAGDFLTDPYAAFGRMSEAEQDRVFGKANAQAIRDGADMYKVVNLAQRETPRSLNRSGRMTLDEIYAEAGDDRAEAVSLLRREGYLTGRQEIRQQRERFATPSKRPVVPGSARARVLEARRTGQRDPLDRATMTAAEQRLFDAVYRLQYAKRNGYVPRSVGVNSADDLSGSRGLKLTPDRLDLLQRAVERQIADAGRYGTASLYRLIDALGLNDDRADIVHERLFAQMQRDYLTATRQRSRGTALTLAEALRNI